MSEWREVKLNEVSDIQTGPFGSQLHKEDYVFNGTPIVTVEHLGNKSFSKQNLPCVKESDKIRLSKYILNQGDIVFSRVGSVDRCSFVTKETDGWMFSGRCLRVRPYSIDPEYLYYFFTLSSTKKTVRSIAVGTTMPSINTTLLSNIIVSFPKSKEEQRSIASILSALDDKIAVNRRICENLEAQAQALFKHWFIDFAPFKNGQFVDSELGMIPEGWRVGRLDELGDIVGGATPSKAEDSYYTSKGIAWLTPKDLSNKLSKFTSRGEIDLTQEGYNSCSAKLMPKGSVLFSSRAPIGYLTIAKNDICTNQGFKSVVPKYAGTAYIYYLLKTNTKRIESMSSGTTFKEASGSLMKSLAVIIPPKSIIDNYEASVLEIFKEQEVIEDESTRLSTLRDTLLPKLMSGQIKV